MSIILANAFIELVEYLFQIPGVKVFLSERISQDPLEKYFGRQRQRGCVNENPTAAQFLKNDQALRVINSINIDTGAGNTRGTNCKQIVVDEGSNDPLPKRRYNHSKKQKGTAQTLLSKINGSTCFDFVGGDQASATPDEQAPSKQASAKPDEQAPGKQASAKPDEQAPGKQASAKPDEQAPGKQASAKPDEQAPGKQASAKPDEQASAKPTTKAPSQTTLLSALTALKNDPGFVTLNEVHSTLELACHIIEWAEKKENIAVLKVTSDKLIVALKEVIKCYPGSKRKRESLWRRYYAFITSEKLTAIWNELFSRVGREKESTRFLNFFATDVMFRQLIKAMYPTAAISEDYDICSELTDDEEHALGYVGGWLIRSQVDKIDRQNHPRKEEMIEALLSFKENTEVETTDKDIDTRTVPVWARIMNRGGLYICNIQFYDFLCAMEGVVKGILKGNEEKMKKGFASVMHKAVKENEDVLFFWTSACATIDQELKNLLLDKIIQGYVALRGHAYAAQWMEEHKRKTKKSVAKTRSFRSRLQPLT